MRLDRDGAGPGPTIQGFSGTGFRIDGIVYSAGVLLTPDEAVAWAAPVVTALDIADLAPVLALDPAPEFLLLGTGATLVRPTPTLIAALEARRIGVEAMDSRAAARAWGVLRGEGRVIVAALLPLG